MRIARRSVSPILFAVLIGMAFPAHGGDEPAERREQKEIFPAIQSIPKGSFELLITDDPVEKYDDRKILDRAKVEFAKTNEWQSFKLAGDKPEHRFNVKLRHTGWVMEVQLEVVLHDKLRRSLVIRNRADMKIKRLWISRDYVHGDLGRSDFPKPESQKAWEGQLWFATLKPGAVSSKDRIAETRKSFKYGESKEGKVELDLHAGYRYVLEWKAQKDEHGRDYRTRWYKGDELLAETLESVFHIHNTQGCVALRMASYCDTDDI